MLEYICVIVLLDMKKIKYLSCVILLLLGIYMLADHYPPLPLNHEQIGLGVNHMSHGVVGVIFIVVAVILFWKRK